MSNTAQIRAFFEDRYTTLFTVLFNFGDGFPLGVARLTAKMVLICANLTGHALECSAALLTQDRLLHESRVLFTSYMKRAPRLATRA